LQIKYLRVILSRLFHSARLEEALTPPTQK
jgi:hypothetical protein